LPTCAIRPWVARSRGGVKVALSFETDGPTYFREANDQVLLMAQIETAQSIENIDAIAAVEGIDCLFVGPNDLAASYGLEYPGAWKDQTGAYGAAIDAVPAAAARAGKIPGILANSPAMANECIARGYTLVVAAATPRRCGKPRGGSAPKLRQAVNF